jgi:Icc-related predicted phosphoesterase
MRIQVMSDLHREFYPEIWIPEINDDVDYIILAGDTSADAIRNAEFLNEVASRTKATIICIPGNHEYYGHIYPEALSYYKEQIGWEIYKDKIKYLNQEFIIDGDIAFLCATLWTDFDKGRELFAPIQYLNDYSQIRVGNGKDTVLPRHLLKEHKETLEMFQKALEGPLSGKKVIMVTHHAPSYQSVPRDFRGHAANCAYVSSLEPFIAKYEPIIWIHGHCHNFFDYQLGPTRVVCNPVGYPKQNEYKENYIIEV